MLLLFVLKLHNFLLLHRHCALKTDYHVCNILSVAVSDMLQCPVLFVCLFVYRGMVCVCDPEHSARTLHIPGLHLYQESLSWLACAAGTAAWQADAGDKVGSQHRHCCHLDMTNGDSGVSQCDVHSVSLPEVFVQWKPTRCSICQIYFGKELCMFQTDLLSIIRRLNTVLTTLGVCHTGYVAICHPDGGQ
jgi:hypothetical protein